jgi:hypothetical protein
MRHDAYPLLTLCLKENLEMKNMKQLKGEGEIAIILGVAALGAWLTHVVTCISDDRWGMLIAGGLVFPVGIIHGIGIWFGFW